MGTYQPPLTITPNILNLAAKVSEQPGCYHERENKVQVLLAFLG